MVFRDKLIRLLISSYFRKAKESIPYKKESNQQTAHMVLIKSKRLMIDFATLI